MGYVAAWMVLVWGTSMNEAVRTTASPAATWAIAVIATILALFMAKVAMLMDLRVAREQRRERMLGIAPEAGDAWAMEAGSEWPRLSQALLAAAGVPPRESAEIRRGVPDVDAAGQSSTLSVVDASAALAGRPAIVGDLPAGGFPRDMSLSPGGVLLVSDFQSGQVQAIATADLPAAG